MALPEEALGRPELFAQGPPGAAGGPAARLRGGLQRERPPQLPAAKAGLFGDQLGPGPRAGLGPDGPEGVKGAQGLDPRSRGLGLPQLPAGTLVGARSRPRRPQGPSGAPAGAAAAAT